LDYLTSSNLDMDCFDAQTTKVVESEFIVNCTIASFKHLIVKRHECVRNLCILLVLVRRYNEKLTVGSNKTEDKLSSQVNDLLNMFNCYEVVKWLCDIYPYPIHKSCLDTNKRRTNDLVNESTSVINANDYDQTVLKLFTQTFARNVFTTSNGGELSTCWLPSISNEILNRVWPQSPNHDFVRFLMHNVQYIHLNSYCSLMKWWTEGKYMRYFLLGHCCLYWNEIDQSIDLFLKASFNLDDQTIRDFLMVDEINALNYYTKIIHYYDLNGNTDAIIELIHKAIPSCKCQLNRSKLYCILFKSYMDLEYYEQAFEALMTNTDAEWKRNCLKQFVVELCNQNKASVLIDFEYSHMQEYVKELLHKRALASDLRTHDYYSILYAFFLKNSDYIKAAGCMYEYAQRLKKEQTGMSSLLKQEKCYLACLNCLKLVNSDYAWLAVSQSDGCTIVKYEDINKSYLIVYFTIRISAFTSNQNTIATYFSVDELVGLLVKYGLLDDAIILCLTFKSADQSPLANVFTSLVER
jgi:hypothetical protein